MERYEIPLLTVHDIECRVQSISNTKNGVGAILLLYKDARVDMRILDQVFGVDGWQRTHEVINGNLFCNIDIWDGEKKCWIRKQDVGTESNTEKQKGEASDSFKRAGTNVGIGRELYTAPFIYIKLNDGEFYKDQSGKVKGSASLRFTVADIGYNERREIDYLVIKDAKGVARYSYGKKSNKADDDHQSSAPAKQHNYSDDQLYQLYLAASNAGFTPEQINSSVAQKWKCDVHDITEDIYQSLMIWLGKKADEKRHRDENTPFE